MTTTKINEIKRADTLGGKFTIDDFYRVQKKLKDSGLTLDVYRKIIRTFMLLLIDKLINEGLHFNLPYGLGIIRVIKKKLKAGFREDGSLDPKKTTLYRDISLMSKHREKTDEFEKDFYQLDIEHSVKLKWHKGIVRNISMFYFKPSKEIRKELFYLAKDNSLLLNNYTHERERVR